MRSDFPIYASTDGGALIGYTVCRIDKPCLWVEHFFISIAYRRKDVATMLYGKAEEMAISMGEDMAYNFVHPSSENMIRFLRSKGYTVVEAFND